MLAKPSPRTRLYTVVLLIMMLYELPFINTAGSTFLGAQASLIRIPDADKDTIKRDNSPTAVCNRWSHQSAVVNGTLYLYGGHAISSSGQSDKTWNNNFLSLPLNEGWDISAPKLTGLPQPSGPPAVSNGYLWNSYDALYLYGGLVSDSPPQTPDPYSLWKYDIKSSSWSQHKNPKTSAGNNSDGGNQPVQQAAEGAGISVPALGKGWYFGGHLDHYTTPGWSLQVARQYLKSLVEFTFPGYSNDGVESLSGGKTAGDDGVWRNITEGGIQDTAAFPNRADGVLLYVPGYGQSGIILSLAGGTNVSFTQMNIIDVYDIANSTWYKQTTSGKYPSLRVNPCAVAASAPDGSSTNVYLYGGQNLIPYGDQIQYDDMWILTIPSFTWIEVDTTGQSVPPARVGHTCNIWDGQIVVIGGYTGPDLSCDSGFYVFSASNLTWQNQFTALSGGNDQNQQVAQQHDSSGLSGSYGYQVPGAVQSVIGGHGNGGATITAPAQSATQGPLATGKPITYTVTGANGAVVTETGTSLVNGSSSNDNHGPNVGAIVAGVVAGCFAVLAAYLGFCAWVYRRQLALYKNHVAASQRAAASGPGNPNEKSSFLTSEGSSDRRATNRSSGPGTSGYSNIPPSPGVHPPVGGNSTANSSSEDLMRGVEPSFVGVLLNPRRSLRVINRD